MQHSDVPSNVFNWLYRTQSSKQRVITSFARWLEMSSLTLTPQSKGKKGRKEVDGWHKKPLFLPSSLLSFLMRSRKSCSFPSSHGACLKQFGGN